MCGQAGSGIVTPAAGAMLLVSPSHCDPAPTHMRIWTRI